MQIQNHRVQEQELGVLSSGALNFIQELNLLGRIVVFFGENGDLDQSQEWLDAAAVTKVGSLLVLG